MISAGQRVVAVLTGHLLKDPGSVTHYHLETEPAPPGANRPIEIEARLADVQRVLKNDH
jgi:threonine synthase